MKPCSKFGVGLFLGVFWNVFCSPRLHLFDTKYSNIITT